MSPLFDLSGKVAVVTGGNGGLGLAMARGLAGAGARIVVAGRSADKSRAAVEELRALGPDPVAIAADVTDEASVAALVAGTVERCGRLDVLVNNAGINVRKPPQDFTLEEWRRVVETNLTGAFLCARAAYAPMKKGGGGKIINVGSMFSIFGTTFAAAYAASKGGVVQLTRSLAVSWAPDNIQVNAILPGWIDTELTRETRRQIPGLHERVLARTPAGRWGSTADLAGSAVFLASGASDFITGVAIPVDGGYAALG
jgi:2-deoxy-D-gluconate 3-dehydrogenase